MNKSSTQAPKSPPPRLEAAEASLGAWVRQARARAARLGRPVLLEVHHPLPGRVDGPASPDPWAFLPGAPARGARWWAWHDPASEGGGLTVAAFGVAARQVFTPGRPFDGARAFRSRLFEQLMEVPSRPDGRVEADVPLCLGGFSFSLNDGTGPWQGWSGGELAVPADLVYARADRLGLVLRRWVGAQDWEDELVQALARDLAGWEAGAPNPQASASDEGGEQGEPEAAALEDRASFCARVRSARGAVQDGRLGKVVVARAVEIDGGAAGLDPVAVLYALRQGHPSAMSFAVGRPGATFLGATPEVLVRVSGSRVETAALAGTAPRGDDPGADLAMGVGLQRSAKDGEEHRAVVAAIESCLRPSCSHLTVDPEPRLRRLSDLQHLETRVVGRATRPGAILDLVEALHPTPALGGWPRDEACRWLQEHEALDRGWFGGPIGWSSAAGDGVFAVAIRAGLVLPHRVIAFAGAGIVGGSDPEAEWNETELKLRPMRGAVSSVLAGDHPAPFGAEPTRERRGANGAADLAVVQGTHP